MHLLSIIGSNQAFGIGKKLALALVIYVLILFKYFLMHQKFQCQSWMIKFSFWIVSIIKGYGLIIIKENYIQYILGIRKNLKINKN